MVRVNFVCLGNICRSPMAEAIFKKLVADAGLQDKIAVDSSGTGSWHIGEPAHRGTRQVLRRHGIHYEGRARQVTDRDVDPAHYVIAMDESNLNELRRRFGDHPRLYRLLDFTPESEERDVPDPYYTGNFEHVYRLVAAGCRALLGHICQKENL